MSSVPMRPIDLMTPPVVKTIEQRSLIVGLVSVSSPRLAHGFVPTNFSALT